MKDPLLIRIFEVGRCNANPDFLNWEQDFNLGQVFSSCQYKGQGRTLVLFYLLSLTLTSKEISSQALQTTSLGLQSLAKTRWDIQPCVLKNNWILGPSIGRQPLMDKLDHNLYSNKSPSLTNSFYQLFSSKEPYILLKSDTNILCVVIVLLTEVEIHPFV